MDDVDRWTVESVIASRTGGTGRLYVPGEDPNILLSVLIETRPTVPVPVERRFNVFMVEGGTPDLFTLTGFSPAVICFHPRYAAISLAFRSCIMDDPQKNTIETLGIGALFELASTIYLTAGNYTFATSCFLQSLIETHCRVADEDDYKACNRAVHVAYAHERLISPLCVPLYFGLAHEIGHAYASDCFHRGLRTHPRDVTDAAITQAAIKVAGGAFSSHGQMSDYFLGQWQDRYRASSEDGRSPLHHGALRSEILADHFGVSILCSMLTQLSRSGRRPLPLKTMVSELIIALFVVQLLESCKYLAAALPTRPMAPAQPLTALPEVDDAPLRAQLYASDVIVDFQIAHAIRWEFIKPTLVSLVMLHLFPDTFSVRNGEVVTNCSQSELQTRESKASSSLEGYLAFYTSEMRRLQGRLEDVVHFVAHLATDQVPAHLVERSAPRTTFDQLIAQRFDIYLKRLDRKRDSARTQYVLARLRHFADLLTQMGGEQCRSQLDSVLQRMQGTSA